MANKVDDFQILPSNLVLFRYPRRCPQPQSSKFGMREKASEKKGLSRVFSRLQRKENLSGAAIT